MNQTPQQEAEKAWKDKYAGWEVVAITEFKNALIKKIEARIEYLRAFENLDNYSKHYIEENKRLLNTIKEIKP